MNWFEKQRTQYEHDRDLYDQSVRALYEHRATRRIQAGTLSPYDRLDFEVTGAAMYKLGDPTRPRFIQDYLIVPMLTNLMKATDRVFPVKPRKSLPFRNK